MKLLLSTLIALSATISMADVVKPASSNLTVITEGSYQVKMATSKCGPNGRCLGMKAVLELDLRLLGCVDSAHVTYSVLQNPKNNDVKVIVSALNVGNPKSLVTLCRGLPVVRKTITLGSTAMLSKNVSVEFLQNAAQ